MYGRCARCGHETALRPVQAHMVNERLDAKAVRQLDGLERFKRRVTRSAALERHHLVDMGSGSGRFLFHNQAWFHSHTGVEITQPCVAFSRAELGLNVVTSVEAVERAPSVVTFWHSMEHLPSDVLNHVLDRLAQLSNLRTRLVVSVPNGHALQYRLFHGNFALDDPGAHVHVFTPQSLDLLLARFGFRRISTVFSPEYSAFSAVQTALNLAMPNALHDYAYHRLKRGLDFGLRGHHCLLWDAYTALLLGGVWPALALTAHDMLRPQHAAVVTAIYEHTGG